MNCGCPVIASNAASIPEVCGEAALYFDPHSPTLLNERIRALFTDQPRRQSMRQAGHARARTFAYTAPGSEEACLRPMSTKTAVVATSSRGLV